MESGKMETLLKVENYEVIREGFALSLPELKVDRKKVTCLTGKSGSGKSTLLLSLAGFVAPTKGTVFYEQKEITHLRPEARGLGIVFQRGALFPHLNVLENVEFGLKMRGEKAEKRKEKAMTWLNRLQIAELANKKTLEISGGEAQRVALARVLVMDFPVILLDEPFSSLDVELRKDLRAQLKALIETHERGALLVTHDPDDVKELASFHYQLEKGQIHPV